jgi:hypothetical protein
LLGDNAGVARAARHGGALAHELHAEMPLIPIVEEEEVLLLPARSRPRDIANQRSPGATFTRGLAAKSALTCSASCEQRRIQEVLGPDTWGRTNTDISGTTFDNTPQTNVLAYWSLYYRFPADREDSGDNAGMVTRYNKEEPP